MLSVLKNRFEQGNKTSGYPREKVELPRRYRGLPRLAEDAPAELVERCVAACPQGGEAIHKEPNGAVVIDHENCIKCQLCVNNCPYGVPRFDGDAAMVRKCVFCLDRLELGVEPACVSTCPADALVVDSMDNIVALAEDAVADGCSVYGSAAGSETSWLYIFPEGIDPEEIIVTS